MSTTFDFNDPYWFTSKPYEHRTTGEIRYLCKLDIIFFEDIILADWKRIEETESIKVLFKESINVK